MDLVSLVKCTRNFDSSLEEAVESVDGFSRLKSPVLIKPNICIEDDRTGFANSKLDAVDTIIRLVFRENTDLAVRVVEADSTMKNIENAFKKLGFSKLAKKYTDQGYDVSLINLSSAPSIKVELD